MIQDFRHAALCYERRRQSGRTGMPGAVKRFVHRARREAGMRYFPKEGKAAQAVLDRILEEEAKFRALIRAHGGA